ncbi:MAG: 5-formyltetrahydrofolate cyclo-ligase [Crocinitomicaceae bacterium]
MTKEELREYYLKKRELLAPKQLDDISQQITHMLFSNYQLDHKMVSLFLPIERKKEINTYLIWEKARSFDAKVAVPKINSRRDIKHIVFDTHDQLEISTFGIPEPKKGRVVAAEHFEYVFLPLLTFDEQGNRVGYGGGYYDRFLTKCAPRCKFIGLSQFPPTEETIEGVLPTDVKLHACITPDKIYRFE